MTGSDNKNIVEEVELQEEVVKEDLLEEQYQTKEEEEDQSVESPLTENDFVQEKIEPVFSATEEERHTIDDFEKDFQLHVETEDTDDMESQLNPDAKEFVPLSPPSNTSGEFQSPPPGIVENGKEKSPLMNPLLSNFGDAVVSQSPRKAEALIMEDVQVPEENEFDQEADARPHEVNLLDENFTRIESPEEVLNLKEAMQADDKLEQGYKDDSQGFTEEIKLQTSDEYQVLESSFDQYSNGFQSKIDDPMNRSFYEGRDTDILADPAKNILNTTQPLSEDDEPEANHQLKEVPVEENDQPEADLLGGVVEQVVENITSEIVSNLETIQAEEPEKSSQMESSDNFEAEKFVEEIKGMNDNFNKYVDTELSPTIPEFKLNEIQTVEETIIVTHSPMKTIEDVNLDTFITETSTASDIEIPQNSFTNHFMEFQRSEINDIPEVVEPSEEKPVEASVLEQEIEQVIEKSQEDAKIEEPKSEIIAAVAATAAVVAAGTAIAKKKAPATKIEAKKATDVKSKVPSKPAEVKKVAEVKPRAPITKPSSGPAKTLATKSTTAATKPTVPSSATSRPKPTTTIPPIKKAPLAPKPATATSKVGDTKPAPVKIAPIRKPATSAAATK